KRTEGMAIRRTGYDGWLRNIAVALGNAPPSEEICNALNQHADDASAVVREHVAWALRQQAEKAARQHPDSHRTLQPATLGK
ncbi:MAG: hypothetical protein ABI178_03315, partial [Rhodanobacter sp.]